MPWMKIDDGIADHPKIQTVGPVGFALYMRGICYANRKHTDGLLPFGSIGAMTHDMDPEIWPQKLIDCGLWEHHPQGYMIHDFLEWNESKEQHLARLEVFKLAGQRGGKLRWKNKKRKHSLPYTPPNSPPVSLSIGSQSISISSLNPLNALKTPKGKRPISESDSPTEKHLAFARDLGINVGAEFAKFKNYCLAHDKRYADFNAAFRNWLANAPRMQGGNRVLQ